MFPFVFSLSSTPAGALDRSLLCTEGLGVGEQFVFLFFLSTSR